MPISGTPSLLFKSSLEVYGSKVCHDTKVRELVGGIYFGEHKRDGDKAIDVMEYDKDGIRKPVTFAFEAAKLRRKKVTVVDKANVLETSRLWREVARDIASSYLSGPTSRNIAILSLRYPFRARHCQQVRYGPPPLAF